LKECNESVGRVNAQGVVWLWTQSDFVALFQLHDVCPRFGNRDVEGVADLLELSCFGHDNLAKIKLT